MPEGIENLTPMLRQYLEIKERHRDAILFFRLGDFYEMFFEDAQQASRILDIALTSRNKNSEESIPLCGIPFHAASGYIRKLIEQGMKVAICEQVEDPKAAKGIVKREVIRVITPGLYVEGEDGATQANYLAAAQAEGEGIRLAFLDLATGEVWVGFYEGFDAALQELVKHQVKEFLLGPGQRQSAWIKKITEALPRLLLTDTEEPKQALWGDGEILTQEFLASKDALRSPTLEALLNRLLTYVYQTQKSLLHHLSPIQVLRERQFLGLDERTFRHLELIHNARGEGSYGTLFWVLNRTATAMGARRLKRWIHYPLMEIAKIQERQIAIQEFLDHPERLHEVQEGLKSIQDIERMLGKLALSTVNARDLQQLALSLKHAAALMAQLQGKFSSHQLATLLANYPDLSAMFEGVLKRLQSECPMTIREGGMIAPGVHPELDELRAVSHDGKSFIAAMESGERERTGISSLKIRYNKVFGYYIEITHTHRDSVPADYIRKQTLVNAERYITPQLKEYENKVLGAEERIKAIEYEIFCQIRGECAGALEAIRKVSEILGTLDVYASLARVARDHHYSCPELTEKKVLVLRDSRHPVLEQTHPDEKFIPNDIEMTEETGSLFLITGPNMAGKSTVMRQAAVSILMAQMGSFVPAKEALVGIADQLFTRIGASDDLSRGQSTFMVEMLETAHILKSATARSFIVLDEIGRGTSTYDGMSIAWAIAEFVAKALQCRALFATHYHELTELAVSVPGIANYQVAVKEWNDQILFLRKLIPGGASRSYGIEVARLAGLPDGLLARAREVLHSLENMEDAALKRVERGAAPSPQLGLFEARVDPVLEELKNLSVETMSPIEALNFLYQLKGKM